MNRTTRATNTWSSTSIYKRIHHALLYHNLTSCQHPPKPFYKLHRHTPPHHHTTPPPHHHTTTPPHHHTTRPPDHQTTRPPHTTQHTTHNTQPTTHTTPHHHTTTPPHHHTTTPPPPPKAQTGCSFLWVNSHKSPRRRHVVAWRTRWRCRPAAQGAPAPLVTATRADDRAHGAGCSPASFSRA